MAKKLTNLFINKIALVDRGANPSANISFFKRKGEDMKTLEEVQKQLDEVTSELAIAKAISGLNDQEKEFHKSLTGDDAKAFLEMDSAARAEKMGDKVKKMVAETDLQAVQKALDEKTSEIAKRDEEIAKLKESNAQKDLIAEVQKRFPLTAGTLEEKAQVLKSIKAMPEEAQKVVLKAMDDVEKSLVDLSKEKGGASDDLAKSANETLVEKAKKIAADEKITYEQAFAKFTATDEGKNLVNKSRSEQ